MNHLPMKMEQTECSETSVHKIQTPGNNPEESIQHSEHRESLKSRTLLICCHEAKRQAGKKGRMHMHHQMLSINF